jgi:hypothetical protein
MEEVERWEREHPDGKPAKAENRTKLPLVTA